MIIQITTDNNVSGQESFTEPIRELLHKNLERFSDRVTSFQVHLGDENAGKHGERDKRCMIEARLDGGLEPIAVTAHADNHQQAVRAAIDKIKKAISSQLEKLRDKNRRPAE